MRRWLPAVSIAFLLVAFSGSPAHSQESLVDLGNRSARVDRAPRGGRLAPARASQVEVIRAFLRARHDEATVRDLVQHKAHDFGGVSHVTLRQQVAGLDVYGTYVKASFAANGDLVSVAENLVSGAQALRPAQVGASEALGAVLARFYPGVPVPAEQGTVGGVTTFARTPPLTEPATATRTALPLRGAVLDTGYLVVTWDRDNMLRHTIVSGRGEILGVEVRTSPDSYRIFQVSPGVSGPTLVQGPAPSAASPFGWLGLSTTTVGNNVDAYLDRDNNDAPDGNGRPIAADQSFNFLWDGAAEPTTATNQLAAVTNLFYLNNVLHDRLFGYGFTESAGNFQQTNVSGQGLGGDPVNAEAQDGGAMNNANFATPPDGERPRMQMYLWNTATPNRDGDLDSDIVYHEYGHGLTWRMIGDMSTVTGGAVGEGMSDALATYFNGDDRVAEYSSNNAIGIRQYPYTNYPRTYSFVVGILGPHLDGEIYAATLWRLRQIWLSRGWSQDILLTHIVDGMNYTIPRPAYENMRDGILASIANLDTGLDSQQTSCTVWDAFAQFGIGVGASGTELCVFGGLCLFQAVESFVKPPECPDSPVNQAPAVSILLPTPGTTVPIGALVNFEGSASDNEDGALTASMTWTSSLQGTIGSGGSFARSDLVAGTHVILASVTDSGNLVGTASVTLTVQPANTAPTVTITSPPSGTTVTAGTSVAFTGSASDNEDGALTASMTWTSSLQGTIGSGGSFTRSDLVAGTHVITASVTDSGNLVGTASVTLTVQPPNTAPTVTITAPANGTTVTAGTSVTFTGSAADTPDGNLSASLVWTSSLQGTIGSGGSFTRSDLVAGTHVITASVTDSGNLVGTASVTLTVQPPNTAPTVTITAPANGTTVTVGTSVTFTGSATDMPDGNLSASLVWMSNLQGQIGTGASVSTSSLIVGAHAVTASVTDSGGLVGTAAIVVTVNPAPVPYTLSAVARVTNRKRFVDLSWSGATGTNVEIHRDNVRVVASTPNDGLYTDQPKGKGSSFTYRVCNVGGTVCSNNATAAF